MAITQIAKITHRKGLLENLPQLDVGELGWAYDQRRLFIGNAPPPYDDNTNVEFGLNVTEILTTESSLLDLASTYQYQGNAAGYAHSTVQRTLTDKLDEYVSVKDYGAIGDGATDDTLAIQDALADLYTQQLTPQTRRILFFPAGEYVVTDAITLPSYAYLAGEGRTSSIIRFENPSILLPYVVGAGLSTSNLVLQHIGVQADTDVQLVAFSGVNGALLDDVALIGPGANADSTTLITIEGVTSGPSAVTPAENIYLHRCLLDNAEYAAKLTDVRNVVIDQCEINDVKYGIRAESVTHVRTTLNRFSNVIFYGQYYDATSTLNSSHFNSYINVANGQYDPIISFMGPGNISIGDTFERSLEFGPWVELNDSASIAFENAERVVLGGYMRDVGVKVALQANASEFPLFSRPLPDYSAFAVDYTIRRDGDFGPAVRTGRIRVAGTFANAPQWEDEYSEDVDAGIEFSVAVDVDVIYITYTLVNNANTGGTITYSITKLS